MDRIIIFLIGVLIGTIVYALAVKSASIGTLRIAQVDPEESPYLFLELDKPVHTVMSKSTVIMKVNRDGLNSQR